MYSQDTVIPNYISCTAAGQSKFPPDNTAEIHANRVITSMSIIATFHGVLLMYNFALLYTIMKF